MTAYKPYGTKATTKQRMARKRARGDVFRFNRAAARLARRARRLARQAAHAENEEES